MSPARAFHQAAEALHHAFDQSFQEAPPPPAEALEEFLCVRVGAERFAVRLSALAGVAAAGRFTPLPSSAPHLIGLAGLRGQVVPVFELAGLLGRPRAQSPRWLLLCGGEAPLALAVAELSGRVRLSPSCLKEGASPEGMTLLDLPRLVGEIRSRGGGAPQASRSTQR
jgi:purine-binding chemotaxis protein CheW